MSAFSAYAARSERVTDTLANQPLLAVTIASSARQPEEDGYPISGDMLAVKRRGKDSWRVRRRRILRERAQ